MTQFEITLLENVVGVQFAVPPLNDMAVAGCAVGTDICGSVRTDPAARNFIHGTGNSISRSQHE